MSLATQISSLAGRIASEIKAVRSELASGLAGKSSTSHAHALDDLTDVVIATPASGQAVVYNGTTWVNSTVSAPVADGSITDAKITSGGLSPSTITGTAVITTDTRLSDARTPTAHTHPISDVTSLQSSLDGKAALSHTHTRSQVTDFAHAATHASGGADAITVAQSQVTNLTTDLAAKATTSSGTAFPSSPANGQIFVRTTTRSVFIYNGVEWLEMTNNPVAPFLIMGV